MINLNKALYLFSLWSTLAHVDSAVYGVPNSGLTRRKVEEKIWLSIGTHLYDFFFLMSYLTLFSGFFDFQVLEQYQVYGDAVLGTYGNNRPNIRELIKVH